jgi:predicted nucleic acid-binding protein
MPKAFVDTNVILRLLIKDDDLKTKAAAALLKKAGQQNILRTLFNRS